MARAFLCHMSFDGGSRGAPFLFPDAEMGKDVAEDVVGMNSSGDLTEMVKGLSGVNRHEVSWDAVAESVAYSLQGRLGRGEGLEVAQVGNHKLVALVIDVVLVQKGLK